ncbi:MAG: restriction endonuclease subunit S [Oscillospiraceae bacterium]|nr:restriction endonuclease subunit S [Oscillospiraceae bacterium]
MTTLDTSKWCEFLLTDLFFVDRGRRLTKENREAGDIPLITAGYQNQGVAEYISTDVCKKYSDKITIDMFGNSFYRNYDFYCDDNILVLIDKVHISLYAKLFIATVISADKYRYSYGKQYRQKDARKHIIKLPQTSQGTPDWFYMENYIKSVSKTEPISTVNHSNSALPLDAKKWTEYALGELFKFQKGKRLTKADMIEGDVNFIGAISDNNGVRQFIDVEPMGKPNCITVNYNGSVGEAFYQNKPFWASDDVNIFYANGWLLNKYIAMFIITAIKANRYRFSYGRKWTLDKMKDSLIKLPQSSDGSPDWAYMESYIKALPYGDRI